MRGPTRDGRGARLGIASESSLGRLCVTEAVRLAYRSDQGFRFILLLLIIALGSQSVRCKRLCHGAMGAVMFFFKRTFLLGEDTVVMSAYGDLDACVPEVGRLVSVAVDHYLDTALSQGTLCGLDNLDHTDAASPISERLLVLPNALQEMLAFKPQGFLEMDVGAENASVMVRELELAESVGSTNGINALVVDLELLVDFQIVVNDHLLAADDRDPARLTRIEPTHAGVSKDSAGESQRHVRDIFDSLLNTGNAPSAHAPRRLS